MARHVVKVVKVSGAGAGRVRSADTGVCSLGELLQLGKRNLCCGGMRYRTHAQAAALSLEKAKHILRFKFLCMMHSSYNLGGGSWEFSISAKTGLIQTGGTSAGSDA